MRCLVIFLAFLPLLALCDVEGLKDGHCPPPPPLLENFDPANSVGVWYDTSTNYAQAKIPENVRDCVENKVSYEDGNFYMDTYYKDHTGGAEHLLKKKFTPVEDKNQWIAHRPDGDNWVDHGWKYSATAYEPESILVYGCKEVGNGHIDFYRIRSHSNSPSAEVIEKLKKVAHDNGDDRDFMDYKHDNCNYKHL